MDLGTRTDTLHAESAFRLDRQNPSTRFIVPAQKALSRCRTETGPTQSETARLAPCPTKSHDGQPLARPYHLHT